MWARTSECMLGLWLLMSPFLFRHTGEPTMLANDLATGFAVAVFALASWWRPLAWAHLLTIFVGLWLVGFGRLSETPPLPAGAQNQILSGLVLLMLAVIPNEASLPPKTYRGAAGDAQPLQHEVER